MAGASLLALAATASAQDHSHHQTAPAPVSSASADPHAGHHPETPQTAAHDAHAGHDMPMTSPLGSWPMSRDASGTAWQPDVSEHGGLHRQAGDWSLMGHAVLNVVYDTQSDPRGDDKTFVAGMIMGAARRDFDDGSSLNLRAMVSPDPLMGKDGYPLLLAAGETADGVHPLVDRQHPHDFLMELSASYSRRLTEKDSVYGYIGLPGEPAFGPPAFMHRLSAMDSPEAPIIHHWLDSTHIVFGVTTLGWAHDRFKLEASAFKGEEPDEERWGIDTPRLDSWSVRASWNPTPEWSLQASYADVKAPEQLEPDEDETKLSASAIHTRRLGRDGWWSTSLAFGRKTNDHDESKDAWLLESAVRPNADWTIFGRVERIETDELVAGAHGGHGDLHTVGKASVGVVRDWRISPTAVFELGALHAFNRVPEALDAEYGDSPRGSMVFVRLKIG
jgi:hypothetical protein